MKKILVIEDEKAIRENIKELLEAEHYEVYEASNGKEGITKTRKIKPHLILCDIMMPGLNGYEVIKAINSDLSSTLIPFIFLTAKVERADLRKGMELGADDYIFKPYDVDELIRAVHTRLIKYESMKTKREEGGIPRPKYDQNDKILFRVSNRLDKVTIGKISFITAERQYSNIFLENYKRFVLKKSLSKWEAVLPQNMFVRIHRSTLVNLSHVTKIEKKLSNSYQCHMTHNNSTVVVEVSRRYLKNLKKFVTPS